MSIFLDIQLEVEVISEIKQLEVVVIVDEMLKEIVIEIQGEEKWLEEFVEIVVDKELMLIKGDNVV